MASLGTNTNGQFSVMLNTRAYPQIYVEQLSQDIVNNTSTIRAIFRVQRPNTAYYVYGNYDNTPTVAVSYGWRATPVNFAQYGNSVETIHTIDRTISHNPDGTGSVWVQWDGDLGTGWGTHSFGASYTLNTIPRQASVTSSADLTIGNNLSYTLKNDGGLYVKLVYYVWNGTSYDTVFTSNRGTGTSGTVTLGTTENNIMYAAMPNNTSRACILRAYTYSDSGYTTQVGSYNDKAGTIYVNQTTNKPTFTTYTVGNLDKTIVNTDKYSNTLVSSSTSTLLGADTKMIKNYSKLRAVITSANKMVALNSATAVKYRFAVGSAYDEENYSADSTVNLDVDNATTNSVSVTAYDSRSLTTTVSDSSTITYVADYVPVSLWGMSLTRDNGVDSGTTLAFSGSYFNEYFGGGTSGVQNTITAHYRYKETTAEWGSQTWNSITLTDTDGALSFDDYINGDLGASGFDTEKSFNIEVRIYDKLTNYIIEGTLNVGTPVMDITSSGISLMGKYDTTIGGSLQIAGQRIVEPNIMEIRGTGDSTSAIVTPYVTHINPSLASTFSSIGSKLTRNGSSIEVNEGVTAIRVQATFNVDLLDGENIQLHIKKNGNAMFVFDSGGSGGSGMTSFTTPNILIHATDGDLITYTWSANSARTYTVRGTRSSLIAEVVC